MTQRRLSLVCLWILCAALGCRSPHRSEPRGFREHLGDDLRCAARGAVQDHKNFYSLENFGLLAAGFGVGALVANTPADREIQDHYQSDFRSSSSDDFSEVFKPVGDGRCMFPALGGAWLAGELLYDTHLGDATGAWGERCFRSALVGAPPMLVLQQVTGSSRPGEITAGSEWHFLNDNNGVSGHCFIGALPFINAAKMTDEPLLKAGLYTCSTFAGWSRVNDDAHYTSQAFLGWWMAYCASTAVDLSIRESRDWTVAPLPSSDGLGMAIIYQY